MLSSDNGDRAFVVTPLGDVRQRIEDLYHQAHSQGKGDDFLASFRTIARRLETDPREFGEPVYRLPNAKLVVRKAALNPIHVVFAVHETKAVVFVFKVDLLGS